MLYNVVTSQETTRFKLLLLEVVLSGPLRSPGRGGNVTLLPHVNDRLSDFGMLIPCGMVADILLIRT